MKIPMKSFFQLIKLSSAPVSPPGQSRALGTLGSLSQEKQWRTSVPFEMAERGMWAPLGI